MSLLVIANHPWLAIGVAAITAALGATAFLLLARPSDVVPLSRRRPGVEAAPGALSSLTTWASERIERTLARRGTRFPLLDLAGVRTRPQDLVLLMLIGMIVAGVLGTLLANVLLGLVLAALVPLGVRIVLSVRVGRRRHAFGEQLDDSLQLMASSLRAGHSLLQTFDAVAREAEEPTATEIGRIVNETRVGRDLSIALTETAGRMDSEDFVWVGQAIAINREVGGNLAEVLDRIGVTIRERGQIRRQVKALSAEGRMSAWVLMLLPLVIVGFLTAINPAYMLTLTHSVIGWAMIAASVIMLLIGGLWLRKITAIRF